MRQHNSLVHKVVGNFLCTRFYHNDFLCRGSNGEFKVTDLSFGFRRVDNELAVDKTDENAAYRTVPRNIGNCKGCRSAYHRCNFGRAVGIDAHNRKRKSYVVTEILREKRTDRSVDNAGSKNSLFGRFALAFEVTAGDLARGIHSFVEVDGKRQEVYTVSRLCACGSAAENSRFAVFDENRAVCKACHFTRFDYKRASCKCVIERFVVFELHFGAFDF